MLRWSILIAVSAPTIFGAALERIVCEPNPWVTSNATWVGLPPAPRPQPASASVARTATLARIALAAGTHPHVFAAAVSTQTLVSVRIAWAAWTFSVKRPAWVNDSFAVPLAAVVACARPR